MAKYLAKAKEQVALFKKFSINNIPRNLNQKADVLSKLTSVAFNHLTKEIVVEVLNKKSVDTEEVATIVEEEEDNWMTPIIKCLQEGVWPTDENEARSLRMKITQYVVLLVVLVCRHTNTGYTSPPLELRRNKSKVLEGSVAYKLELPHELSRVHNTFHVSNLKKCYSDEPLAVPLERLQVDDKLYFVEEPVEIIDREVKWVKEVEWSADVSSVSNAQYSSATGQVAGKATTTVVVQALGAPPPPLRQPQQPFNDLIRLSICLYEYVLGIPSSSSHPPRCHLTSPSSPPSA
ncbi:hypothetical protein Tco_0008350 [Tanacetum coccineum]